MIAISKQYLYTCDPGHGWLRVTRAELHRIGVTPSMYSYVKGKYAYLEEDCDMPKFMQVKAFISEPVNILERHVETTKIRTYERYGHEISA